MDGAVVAAAGLRLGLPGGAACVIDEVDHARHTADARFLHAGAPTSGRLRLVLSGHPQLAPTPVELAGTTRLLRAEPTTRTPRPSSAGGQQRLVGRSSGELRRSRSPPPAPRSRPATRPCGSWRSDRSRTDDVPAYIVFDNKTLLHDRRAPPDRRPCACWPCPGSARPSSTATATRCWRCSPTAADRPPRALRNRSPADRTTTRPSRRGGWTAVPPTGILPAPPAPPVPCRPAPPPATPRPPRADDLPAAPLAARGPDAARTLPRPRLPRRGDPRRRQDHLRGDRDRPRPDAAPAPARGRGRPDLAPEAAVVRVRGRQGPAPGARLVVDRPVATRHARRGGHLPAGGAGPARAARPGR